MTDVFTTPFVAFVSAYLVTTVVRGLFALFDDVK